MGRDEGGIRRKKVMKSGKERGREEENEGEGREKYKCGARRRGKRAKRTLLPFYFNEIFNIVLIISVFLNH